MKFWIEEVVLWFKRGGRRSVKFKQNKINVITGDSETGKTAIIQIVDYCLFASKSKLPEQVINENVAWYGIKIHINDKVFTVGRSALRNSEVVDDYFFSDIGDVPETPMANSEFGTLRAVLEAEFSIDRSVVVPFGGRKLRLGSKVSLRFFMMFTTLSEDVVSHSSVFFDKQDDERYVEALHRVFDLALGIEQVSNVLLRAEESRLEAELKRLEKKLDRLATASNEFKDEQEEIVRRSKEIGLLAPDMPFDESMESLKSLITQPRPVLPVVDQSSRYPEVTSEIAHESQIVRNLKALQSEYEEYRKLLGNVEDSLRPVTFLRDNYSRLVQTSIFSELLESLESDLAAVKKDIRKRNPISLSIADAVREREAKISSLRDELATLPQETKKTANEYEQMFFLGEAKAKFEFFGDTGSDSSTDGTEKAIERVQDSLEKINVVDTKRERELCIRLLEEMAGFYIEVAAPALDSYRGYSASFDYTSKALQLRKPQTTHIENIGSSSNHMFLHLILFFAMHEVVKQRRSPFVPPFLIIDQLSRPYWGDDAVRKKSLDQSDRAKVETAFKGLDTFMDRMLSEEGSFQVILLEHVPPDVWSSCKHVELTERFIGGNALVPSDVVDDGTITS